MNALLISTVAAAICSIATISICLFLVPMTYDLVGETLAELDGHMSDFKESFGFNFDALGKGRI